jgi:hypothetical protein
MARSLSHGIKLEFYCILCWLKTSFIALHIIIMMMMIIIIIIGSGLVRIICMMHIIGYSHK